mgnify:CR=1 FL=1
MNLQQHLIFLSHQEEVFISAEANDIKFSTEVNAKRSFIWISSASPNERVKCLQGTPIIIQVDSPVTPAVATNEDIPVSHCDASVGIPMNMDFDVQQGYNSCLLCCFPFICSPFSCIMSLGALQHLMFKLFTYVICRLFYNE